MVPRHQGESPGGAKSKLRPESFKGCGRELNRAVYVDAQSNRTEFELLSEEGWSKTAVSRFASQIEKFPYRLGATKE